jgi:hypothetical protein
MSAAHYKSVEIKGLDIWQHRGNVELYFKYCYKEFNYRIGKLTEYFKFDEVEPVLSDLRQMKPKILSGSELDILEGKAQKAGDRTKLPKFAKVDCACF